MVSSTGEGQWTRSSQRDKRVRHDRALAGETRPGALAQRAWLSSTGTRGDRCWTSLRFAANLRLTDWTTTA